MGKEGDLWDDSALINAFDEAISKYKKMHRKGHKENTNTIADVKSSCLDDPTVFDASQDNNSNPEIHDQKNYNGSHAIPIPEVGETETLETAKGIEITDSEVPEEHPLGSNRVPLHDQSQNHSTSEDMNEYNRLYKEYYEVEEQRQKILEEMQSFSNWHYSYPSETPVSGLQWATSSTTQGYQPSTSQVSCSTMVVSCCPWASQCSTACCSAVPCPLAGGSASNLCVDPLATKEMGKHPGVENADIVKTAMGAAERAISKLKDTTSDSKEKSELNNAAEQNATSRTDLSTVLNAWYSAGFYTGKYLTEQSLAKKQHDSV